MRHCQRIFFIISIQLSWLSSLSELLIFNIAHENLNITDENFNGADKDETEIKETNINGLPYIWLNSIERATNKTRKGNVDVILNEKDETEIGLCHVSTLIPFSYMDDGVRKPIEWGEYHAYIAAFLAARHLNTGDGSVIQEIKEIRDKCNIYFTTEAMDTEMSEVITVDHVIKQVDKEINLPCAFVGAALSSVSIPTAIFTGIKGYPQLSYSATSSLLDNKSLFPLFGRVIPSDDGTSIPLIKYFHERLNVEHLAIIHINDAYGISYVNGLEKAVSKLAPEMKIFSIDIPFDAKEEDYKRIVSDLKDSQYRYFFGVFYYIQYIGLMEEANKQGIAGTGQHNWIFSDGISPVEITDQVYAKNSPLQNSTRGVSIVMASGGRPGMTVYDKFSKAFKNLNNEKNIKYLESILPPYFNLKIDDEFFDNVGVHSAFVYDSTVALGLAACNAAKINGTYFDGYEHYSAILNTSFEGASGQISFNSFGTREPETAVFSLFNIVEDNAFEEEKSDEVKFKSVEADIFQNGKWISLVPYIFNDGTSTIHPDLPIQIVEKNYIGTPLRATCLGMSALIILLSIGFVLWTYKLRDTPVVKASQPFFLNIICFGTVLMGSALIPHSLDDEIVSVTGMNIACMATPWLLSLGFCASFSALLAKTLRVNKIFHNPTFRRKKVTIRNVVQPMLILMVANIVLLSLWTSLAPATWVRETIDVDNFNRVSESAGKCSADPSSIGYVIPLILLDLGSVCLAVYQAFKARGISTEFAESKYIAIALTIILLVSFIGFPVIIIASQNVKAYVFVYSGIVFVICLSLLLLIFVPKVFLVKMKRNKKDMFQSIRKSSGRLNSSQSRIHQSDRQIQIDSRIQSDSRIQDLMKENKELKTLYESCPNHVEKGTEDTERP